MFAIVEKDNTDACHGLFDTKDHAEAFLRDTIPEYVSRGYFDDKTLTADSFKVVRA